MVEGFRQFGKLRDGQRAGRGGRGLESSGINLDFGFRV